MEDYYLIMEQHILSYIPPPILSGKIQLLTPEKEYAIIIYVIWQ